MFITLWKTVPQNCLKKLNIELPHSLPIPLPRCVSSKLKATSKQPMHKCLCQPSSQLPKDRNNTNVPQLMIRVRKMWYIHTMRYQSAIRNEVLIAATRWTDTENIMFSEEARHQRSNAVSFLFQDIARRGGSKETADQWLRGPVQREIG